MAAMKRLTDKVAIVTGGAVGIGQAYVRALAAEGATVIIADIADGSALATAADDGRGAIMFVETDVSDEEAVRHLVDSVVSAAGRIDIVVNNAAVFSNLPMGPFTDIDVELWARVMAVNVQGPFLVAKHVAPVMIARRSGKIINIGSVTFNRGAPNFLHYVTSKGAIVAMTRSLSRELGEHGICVNTLSPGFVLSDSILANPEHVEIARVPVRNSRALKRDAYPDDLIGALIFLASSESDFVTGQTIAVDGGSVNT